MAGHFGRLFPGMGIELVTLSENQPTSGFPFQFRITYCKNMGYK